jgi:hypothetical protein
VDNLPAGSTPAAASEFQEAYVQVARRLEAVTGSLSLMEERVRYLRKALDEAPQADLGMHTRVDAFETALAGLRTRLNGNPAQRAMSEWTEPGVAGRIRAARGVMDTRLPPTDTERESLRIGREALGEIEASVSALRDGELAAIERDLAAAGGPWTPGQRPGGR